MTCEHKNVVAEDIHMTSEELVGLLRLIYDEVHDLSGLSERSGIKGDPPGTPQQLTDENATLLRLKYLAHTGKAEERDGLWYLSPETLNEVHS